MPEEKSEKAKDLVERALDTAIEGDTDKARELVEQARRLDPQAVEEAGAELEEENRGGSRKREE